MSLIWSQNTWNSTKQFPNVWIQPTLKKQKRDYIISTYLSFKSFLITSVLEFNQHVFLSTSHMQVLSCQAHIKNKNRKASVECRIYENERNKKRGCQRYLSNTQAYKKVLLLLTTSFAEADSIIFNKPKWIDLDMVI